MKQSEKLRTALDLAMEGTPQKKVSQTAAPEIVQTDQQALSAEAEKKAKKGIDQYVEAMANPNCKRCHGTGVDGKARVYPGGKAIKGAPFRLEDQACRCIRLVEVSVGEKKEKEPDNLISLKKGAENAGQIRSQKQ